MYFSEDFHLFDSFPGNGGRLHMKMVRSVTCYRVGGVG